MEQKRKIKASTLSVILEGSDSVHCYLQLEHTSCSLTLRFDQGDTAKLCGFPMDWGVHDCNVDYYNYDSPTYAELVQCDGVLDDGQPYISESDEKIILKQLKKSIENQFANRSLKGFKKPGSKEKITILSKIKNAIGEL